MSCLLICLPLLEKATEMRDQVVTEMMNRRERKVRSFAPTHLPFYLTSEEGGRNSIRGWISYVNCREAGWEKHNMSQKCPAFQRKQSPETFLICVSGYVTCVGWIHGSETHDLLNLNSSWEKLCFNWLQLMPTYPVEAFIGFPLKCPCENYGRLILTNKKARERWTGTGYCLFEGLLKHSTSGYFFFTLLLFFKSHLN